MAKEFQVEQSYDNGGKAWIYFRVGDPKPSRSLLTNLAVSEARKDWDQVSTGPSFSAPNPPLPELKVAEFKGGKKVPGGIRFKCTWR